MSQGSEQRSQFLRDAAKHESRAEAAAQRGDLVEAAQAVLKSLDCERRAGSIGPQILQVIKPRS
ncbi:hypothetical protein WH5701_02924 [Synechococcus sp. WH 5701]|jgi:hypothetical protein|uniref:hypothetical protein n=1 Tax=unclassified Synechococcus TaxID=2626047 RepID=UPI0000698417|nr:MULTISPECIES: hypothetical protein [unclassified Synechococcus]EAQ75764.1 hypothetical protein WH5701_02924 [Synechococcus sp. WH 5701]WFN59577.1 hypothetical protein N4320_02925 [Synechococcus sp. CCFWC 502]